MDEIDIADVPELARIADEVRATGRPRLLKRGRETVALLVPAAKVRRSRRRRPVAPDDPLFDLIGMGEGTVAGGVSGKKHEHLAKVYRGHSR